MTHSKRPDLPATTKTVGLCRNARVYSLGTTRMATREETALGLALKLHEEVAEVTRAPTDVSEYADVLQALQDYAEFNGVLWEHVHTARLNKAKDAGTFLPAVLWEAPCRYPKMLCSVCRQPQRRTGSGRVCENGHGGAPSICASCEGTGSVTKADWPGELSNMHQEPCPQCGGTGGVPDPA